MSYLLGSLVLACLLLRCFHSSCLVMVLLDNGLLLNNSFRLHKCLVLACRMLACRRLTRKKVGVVSKHLTCSHDDSGDSRPWWLGGSSPLGSVGVLFLSAMCVGMGVRK